MLFTTLAAAVVSKFHPRADARAGGHDLSSGRHCRRNSAERPRRTRPAFFPEWAPYEPAVPDTLRVHRTGWAMGCSVLRSGRAVPEECRDHADLRPPAPRKSRPDPVSPQSRRAGAVV